MIASSLERIHDSLPESARVLDIGGWGKPFRRADWVLDLMPFETRGLLGHDGDGAERFTADTWVVRDICEHTPYPFEDKSFDFVVCSHTLEDVRDPIFVCSEMNRIGRAGYIETPSRLEEQSVGVQGPWTGWGHHHWLIDPSDKGLEFVFKHHVMHMRESDHFPPGFWATLSPEERVVRLFWQDSFHFSEKIMPDAESLDTYLAGFVASELERRNWREPAPNLSRWDRFIRSR